MDFPLAENERIKAYGKHLDETEVNERLTKLQNEIDDSSQTLLDVNKLDLKASSREAKLC